MARVNESDLTAVLVETGTMPVPNCEIQPSVVEGSISLILKPFLRV